MSNLDNTNEELESVRIAIRKFELSRVAGFGTNLSGTNRYNEEDQRLLKEIMQDCNDNAAGAKKNATAWEGLSTNLGDLGDSEKHMPGPGYPRETKARSEFEVCKEFLDGDVKSLSTLARFIFIKHIGRIYIVEDINDIRGGVIDTVSGTQFCRLKHESGVDNIYIGNSILGSYNTDTYERFDNVGKYMQNEFFKKRIHLRLADSDPNPDKDYYSIAYLSELESEYNDDLSFADIEPAVKKQAALFWRKMEEMFTIREYLSTIDIVKDFDGRKILTSHGWRYHCVDEKKGRYQVMSRKLLPECDDTIFGMVCSMADPDLWTICKNDCGVQIVYKCSPEDHEVKYNNLKN